MNIDELRKQKQREANRRWYNKHKEELSAKRRGTRQEEHKNSYQKTKAEKGSEYFREKAKQARRANPERYREILKRYRLKHPERKLFYSARQRAKKTGIAFDIEITDIIIPEYCPLLELKLEMLGQCDNSPSIDRIDNSKGYIKGNIWVISFKANRMKNTASLDELITFAKNVNSIMYK